MKHDANMEVGQGQAPLAVSARQLATRMGVSLRHIRRADSAGLIPRPVHIGRSVRWPLEEINGWLKAGAPDRRRWEQIRQRQGQRRQ